MDSLLVWQITGLKNLLPEDTPARRSCTKVSSFCFFFEINGSFCVGPMFSSFPFLKKSHSKGFAFTFSILIALALANCMEKKLFFFFGVACNLFKEANFKLRSRISGRKTEKRPVFWE